MEFIVSSFLSPLNFRLLVSFVYLLSSMRNLQLRPNDLILRVVLLLHSNQVFVLIDGAKFTTDEREVEQQIE